MALRRDDAINYAELHWNTPCHDGIIWLTDGAIQIATKRKELKASAADGWQAFFVDGKTEVEAAVFQRTGPAGTEEKLINGWDGLADCAHFLSCCLTAGGATIKERGVRELVAALQARSDTKTLCEQVSRDRAQQVIDTGIFKKGDMIGYFNVDPHGDFGGRRTYTHSTMFVGKVGSKSEGNVTCHTVARFPGKSWVNDAWWLHNGYTYTLIHFSNDDPPPHSTRTPIDGWWKLEYAGRTEYYCVLKDGRARYTRSAPRSTKETLAAGDGSAYWFPDVGGSVTFIWKSTGTVEVWSPDSSGSFTSLINKSIKGSLTRLS